MPNRPIEKFHFWTMIFQVASNLVWLGATLFLASHIILDDRLNDFEDAVLLAIISLAVSVILFTLLAFIMNRLAAVRLKYELELSTSAKIYKTLLANLPNSVVALFNSDLRFIIIDGLELKERVRKNPTFDLGKHVSELEFTSLENKELFEKHYRLAISGVRTEFDFYRGKEIYHTVVIPILDHNNKVVAGMSIAQNVTAERVSKRMLEEEWEALRNLIDTIPDAIYFVDLKGKFLVANQQFLKLLQAKDLLVGKTYQDVFSAELAKENVEEDLQVLNGSEEIRRENVINGRFYEISKTPFHNRGQVAGVVCNYHDVTAQKQAEKLMEELNSALEKRATALEAANHELEAFSYSVSHDLRSPLRAIHGFTQIVFNEYGSQLSHEVIDKLKVVQSNAKKMDELINGLLSFSRFGRHQMNIIELDIMSLVGQVVEEQKGTGRILIKALSPCNGDQLLVKLVFENLISNAVKFSRNNPDALVEIGETVTGEGNTYYVKDNGVGFDVKYATKIFGVFQRFHNATEYEGTGVGLAIVHRIVTRHCGKIWVESEPNRGTTFYFTIRGEYVN
jgi:PAS domain S-box-containing protein